MKIPSRWRPHIDTAFRSLKTQAKKKKDKVSKVKGFGFHVSYGSDAQKNSWAVDVVDKRLFWGSGMVDIKKMAMWEFFLHLGQEAAKVGIKGDMWGGNWGRKPVRKDGMKYYDSILTSKGWQKSGKEVKMGWDSAHIQGLANTRDNKEKLARLSMKGLKKLHDKSKKTS